jgi:hypothetical protein
MLSRKGLGWRVLLGWMAAAPAWAVGPDIVLVDPDALSCPAPFQLSTLQAEMQRAEDVAIAFDVKPPPKPISTLASELSAHIKSVQRMVKDDLPCIREPIDPATAARIHWFVALANVIVDHPQARREALLGARGQSDHFTPPTQGPHGKRHAIWDEYQEQSTAPGISGTLPASRSAGTLAFDGTPSFERPLDRATVAQFMDSGGAVVWTGYAFKDDVLPAYDPVEPLTAAGVPQRRKVGINWPIAGGALAVGAASAVMYGLAISAEREFKDTQQTHTLDELDTLQTQANRRGGVAFGMALAAGAGVAGAVVVGTF